MEIVVTHDMADFDALASAVAAQKLYPGARVVLGRRLAGPVRDFLALHKDRFETLRHPQIDQESVTRLVLVDVRQAGRLRDYARVLERAAAGAVDVHVWDHHPAAPDDVPASVETVAPVGSATTLLLEAIRERGIAIDPIEATLFAIGIYTDTGALTYASTSSRDARAAAYLLDQGASLKMLARYLRPPFSDAQRRVLSMVLDSIEIETVGGLGVAIALVELDSMIDGLAEVTTEATELEGHAALLTIFGLPKNRVQVVGRARSRFVDIGRILKAIGGGGHRAAGSAIVKKTDVATVRSELVAALHADPPQPQVVGDLMSSPVNTVPPSTILSELGESLRVWCHTGVPVVDGGRLVGIVSRRDVQRAVEAGRAHLPVSSCMSHDVQTATPKTPLEEALKRMVERDIGRLPVLRDGHIVGIVTRTDLLQVLYPDQAIEGA